jgi:protein phosphatase
MSRVELRSFTTASRSDVGRVREVNEDFMAEFERPSGHRLLVVADGMGGHKGGATASRLCVETIGDVFHRSSEAPEALLRDSLHEANERIYQVASQDESLTGMGTTAVLLLLTPEGDAWVAHLGDSRAYLLRHGEIEALTEDHTVVAAMVKRGMLTAEAAETHPRRHELVRCVGFHHEPEAEVSRHDVLPGDRFLLCSDGLSGMLGDEELGEILQREALGDAVVTMVEAANARGGVDNITVIAGAIPGGATTVVDTSPGLPATEWLAEARAGERRDRQVRRIAGATAIAAALVAATLILLSLGGL